MLGIEIKCTSKVTGRTGWVIDNPPVLFESWQTLIYLGFSDTTCLYLWHEYQAAIAQQQPDTAFNLWIFVNQWVERQMRARSWEGVYYDHGDRILSAILQTLGLNGEVKDWLYQRHLGQLINREPRRTLEKHILRFMHRKVQILRNMDGLVVGRIALVSDATYYYESSNGQGVWSWIYREARSLQVVE